MDNKEKKPLSPLIQNLVNAIEKKGLVVKFGLEQQGHIKTIEKILNQFNDATDEYVWEKIGKEIGWDAGTAARYYIRYLRKEIKSFCVIDKPKDFKHITLTPEDVSKLSCTKTILFRDDKELYSKLKIAIDAFNYKHCMGRISEVNSRMMMDGGALMYHLITDPEFLKECKNIYKNQNI